MRRYFAIIPMIMLVFFVGGFASLSAAFAQTGTATPTAALSTPLPTPEPPYRLTILHTNDIHANHEPNAQGDGGATRAASVIGQIRGEVPNTLLVNAGDNFTGSLFYYVHRGQDSVELMNAMGYDAMTLGNHEFDDGTANLAAFIGGLKLPVVSANIDFSAEPILTGKVAPYTIIEKAGQKIGVIGLITPETAVMARNIQTLKFDSDLPGVVQRNVDELTKQGVNKIILLSHVGYTFDQDIAKKVKGVDIVVGGHSHTLLSNRLSGSAGPYPTVIKSLAGEPVLVVQAEAFETYLGRLDVEFNKDGLLTKWGGDVILLSHYITPDTKTEALIADLYVPIKKFTVEQLGEAADQLVGDRKTCRYMECEMGDLVTDLMRKEAGADVAIINGGSIRANIEPGKVTMGDVLKVFPFSNLLSTFGLSGDNLLLALENGVSRVDAEEGTGRFLQVSGLQFKFDAKRPVGRRVISVAVLDSASGKFKPLDRKKIYKVAGIDYIRGGGDGYTVLVEKAINPYDYGRPLNQIVAEHFKNNSPVNIQLDGRISILGK